jgi:opacity protein-like surface antigen
MRLTQLSMLFLCLSAPLFAQRHELGFTIGGLLENDRGAVRSKSGTALQFNYGYRFWSNSAVAVSGEIHMLASPLRDVEGPPRSTRDYASLYLTPGVRVKLNPLGRIQPYGVVGGGYALYEQSTLNMAGQANAAPRHINRGAFVYGAGADLPIRKWLALRGEVRDFVTGNPAYFSEGISGGWQHNVVIGGGFVLRFGQ